MASEAAAPLVRWMDLSEYGLALKAAAGTALRPGLLVLEVTDTQKLRGALDSAQSLDGAAAGERWDRWLDDMGFRETLAFAPQFVTARPRLRFEDVGALFPQARREAVVVQREAASVAWEPRPDAAVVEQWRRVAREVLNAEGAQLWRPRKSEFAVPWEAARRVGDVAFSAAELEGRRWGGFSGILRRLDAGQYREQALTGFYADLASAQAAGLAREELECVNLPFALPLWVRKDGLVVALADLREAPALWADAPPERLAQGVAGGFVVSWLRAGTEARARMRAVVERWRLWAEAGEPGGAAQMQDSLREAAGLIDGLCTGYPMVKPRQRGFGAVDLVRWDDAEVLQFAAEVFDVLGSAAPGGALPGQLKWMRERLRAAEQEAAREAARAGLVRVREDLRDGAREASERVVHEDAGEKIGGARKDFHRRAMTAADCEEMTAVERASLVVKANVWPPLDYPALRAAGVSWEAAVAIKCLKDAIECAPYRTGATNAGDEKAASVDYIEAVSRVREAMAPVRTLEEFAAAACALYWDGVSVEGAADYVARGARGGLSIYGQTRFSRMIGQKASTMLFDSFKRFEIVKRGIVPDVPAPVAREIAKRRDRAGYKARAEQDPDAAQESLWAGFQGQRRYGGADRNESLRKDEEQLRCPHLAAVVCEGGTPWRGGRDVHASDLMEQFGFRAVEFGNWLPQSERQSVLNMAFDSLCDLAQALSIPPSGVGLNGRLAVAFGSRGVSHAKAHFEPSRNVINLTRLAGAGALAHEWFHALDWHLGCAQGGPAGRFATAEPEAAMAPLARALEHRELSMAELIAKYSEKARCYAHNAAAWCAQRLRRERREGAFAYAETLFERARAELRDGARVELGEPAGRARLSHGAPVVAAGEEVAERITQALGVFCDSEGIRLTAKERRAVEANLVAMLSAMARVAGLEAAQEAGLDRAAVGDPAAAASSFLIAAKALDARRSARYWSLPHEMFARAGAQYVFYRLQQDGVRNDYLVAGSEEGRFAHHPVGNPNPAGAERERIAARFDGLFDELRVGLLRASAAQPEDRAEVSCV